MIKLDYIISREVIISTFPRSFIIKRLLTRGFSFLCKDLGADVPLSIATSLEVWVCSAVGGETRTSEASCLRMFRRELDCSGQR